MTFMRNFRSVAVPLALGLALVGASCGNSYHSCTDRGTCDTDTGGTGGGIGNSGGSGGSGGGGDTGGTPNKPCDACSGETRHCNTDDECVECLETTHCTNPAAPVCDEGSCTTCTQTTDCAHLAGTPTCNTNTGACVKCTVEDESSCGENSCNPATNSCTTTERGTVKVCKACVADSECETNYRCVPMQFAGMPRDGGYCLKDPDQGAAGCPNPFSTPTIPNRVSLSGAPAQQYCGIVEGVTTCEAVLGAGDPDVRCSGAADCGVPGLNDARCEIVNLNPARCTYSCNGSDNCRIDLRCGGPSAAKYCGGP